MKRKVERRINETIDRRADAREKRRHGRKKRTICATFAMFVLLMGGCGGANNNNSKLPAGSPGKERFDKTDFVMDTVLNMTIYGEEDCSEDVKEVLEDLEYQQLSWRVEDSMASMINKEGSNGNPVAMSEEFTAWTRISLDIAAKSEGAFDPTIGQLTRLWNIEGEHPVVPPQEEIDACMENIGYEHINIEEKEITLSENVTLDLGAVGKGIGCDVACDYLKEREDISGAVVAIGGSIVTYGEKADGSPWGIAVQDPNQADGTPMGVINIEGTRFISTSGDYEKYFVENGKKYHHILDPATGYPSESGLHSVTIVCDNGLLSDGLSTACFVLGAEKGMALAERYGAEAILIDQQNCVYVSEGIKDSFQILEEKYKITTLPCVSK